jgi:hypothetical protein
MQSQIRREDGDREKRLRRDGNATSTRMFRKRVTSFSRAVVKEMRFCKDTNKQQSFPNVHASMDRDQVVLMRESKLLRDVMIERRSESFKVAWHQPPLS